MELTPLSKLKNRTPLCGHLSLLIIPKSLLAALMVFVKEFLLRAEGIECREVIADLVYEMWDVGKSQNSEVRDQQGLRLEEICSSQ